MKMSFTPHGPGFRFLDDFSIEGDTGKGRWHLDPGLAFFKDHFPDDPLVPAALLMESAAQASGALWMHSAAGAEKIPLFVASIDAMRVLAAARPNETLDIRVKLVRELGPLAQFEFETTSSERSIARGRITLSRQLGPAN
jgi:3-hydroxymyristoyl/3-hydroxydecanoyl-(acyl carrier protein) dehydratase